MSNLSPGHLVRKLRIKLSLGHLMRSPMSPGLEWGPTSPTLPQEPDEPGASPGPLQEIADVNKIFTFNYIFYLIFYLISLSITLIRGLNRAFKSRVYWDFIINSPHQR